ncbi:sugar phosphate isomerase/epimerase and 4-hydroxyphenylpyruvate domain-containing protein [Mumia sp. ZJ1417]|uniref:bifunctional sugar phosphate isomerase/epimerase/4-hydroxyphenylpyruvate dioxygenase family protein n=1 Tax=Mumia sp. ZJ1417 TaxID=2708082 RepID=UPI00141DE6A9|nr:sugar phosphate isomerase/epimerase and 4-hydroxyphenylpyruvate domain-containing protein [Mumia sp. ZJ1417]QMW65442.1 sugar phosphate isomerase/epimerase and 4-hydroxyphenylpyruvate domain-containing protein [Mumia sp. ZJ1417]
MRTSIATVCLSGSLVPKLHACAEAGFDGVEIFEPDLVTAYESPEEIRTLADRLGLSLDLYQPFRDFEGVDEETFADNLRRAETKFALMNRLGMDLILVCSNVATATIDSDEVSARQLRALGELAASYGVRIAFEALAWGKYIDDYRRAWRIVERADHPNIGVCLDSFHILSRGHDPSDIEKIPGDKIFYLQLADAPALDMDVLSWSRHHRLFPGEGSFDLTGFLGHVLAAGYTGPLSLEVFNDVFRQTDVRRTAAHAHRSLVWLADQVRRPDTAATTRPLTAVSPPQAFDFVELRGSGLDDTDLVLEQLGFTFRGRHRTKPVRLWSSGRARVILNDRGGDKPAHLAAFGLEVADADAALARARELDAPPVFRQTHAGEQDLPATAAPDGTQILFSDHGPDPRWLDEFTYGDPERSDVARSIDHVNVTQRWQDFDEAVLFYQSVLGLDPEPAREVAGPSGLVRSQVMRTPDGCVRLPLNVEPQGEDRRTQHVAFASDDVVGLARTARGRGLSFLPVPDNYYDDLRARFGLDDAFLTELRSLDLLYDEDADGGFVHFYTRTLGDVFFEFVERRGPYDGYGAADAPVRLAAQRATGAL